MQKRTVKIVRYVGKILIGVLLSVLVLFLLIIGAIQIPYVQNKIKTAVVKSFAESWETQVSVGHISINFLGNVVVNDIFIADQQNDTLLNAGKVLVAVNISGLFQKRIAINKISLASVVFFYKKADTTSNMDFITSSFKPDTLKEADTIKNKDPWTISLKKIDLQKIHVKFENLTDSSILDLQLGNFALNFTETDLEKMNFDIKRIYLENTQVTQSNYATKEVSPVPEAEEDSSANLNISVNEIIFKNVSFQQRSIDSQSKFKLGEAALTDGDFNLVKKHVSLEKIMINHGNITMVAQGTTTENPGTASNPEKSENQDWNISINDAQMGFDRINLENFVEDNASVKNLSKIDLRNVILHLNAKFNGADKWAANLRKLEFSDAKTGQNASLTTEVFMQQELIKSNSFKIQWGESYLAGSAEISLQPKENSSTIPNFKFNVNSSAIRQKDFLAYIGDSVRPLLNRMPEAISYTGRTDASDNIINTTGTLHSTRGAIKFSGQIDQVNSSKNSKYNLDLTINEMDAGYLLNNPTLGKISGAVWVKGAGFSLQTLQTQGGIQLDSIGYNKYVYRNIRLTGKISNGNVDVKFNSEDHLLKASIRINGHIGDKTDVYLYVHAPYLNGSALGFSKDTMSIAVNLKAHLLMESTRNIVLSSDTFHVTVMLPGRELTIHNKIFYAAKGDTVNANVSTSFADISYSGNLPVEKIPAVLQNHFAQYFDSDYKGTINETNEFFNVEVKFKDVALLNEISPVKFSIFEEASIKAEFNKQNLTAQFDIPELSYNDIRMVDLKLTAESTDSGFYINMNSENIHNKSNTLSDINLKANLRNGELQSRFSFANAENEKWFDIGISMEPRNPSKNIRIKPPLVLNHKDWEVDQQNLITMSNSRIQFENFTLSNDEKSIALYEARDNPDKLTMEMKNLDLSFLSELLKGDTTYITGKINGAVSVINLFNKQTPLFDANLDIQNIIAAQQSLGNMKIEASNTENSDVAAIDVSFGLEKNMAFSLTGTYGLKEGIPMNLHFKAKDLNLAVLQTVLNTSLSNTTGLLNASIDIKGSGDAPKLSGEIRFDKTSLFVIPAQTTFKLNNQQINLAGDQVIFSNFTIEDDDGNPMSINGDVSFANLKDIKTNLKINSNTFLAYMGNPSMLPGQENRVILTSNMELSGTSTSPNLKANIQIDENSKFFYKITKQATTLSEEGVIEFKGAKPPEQPQTSASFMKNLNLTANITVTENTELSIITDPANNLGLNMKAGGVFSLMQRPYQDPRLVGKLFVSDGDYTINLSGIKRKLQISDSSTIAWYGNIARPELNLKVYYEVRTSPAGLLGDETAENTSTLPFLVYINITGELSAPELNFQISLPAEYEGVNNGLVAAKLQEINSNESEVNQKAMALLLFGRFDFSNFAGVFSGSGGTNALISNAINQFAAQRIRFVDLHVELESYNDYGEATGENERTEFSMAISRKFLKNKLNTEVGLTAVLQGNELEQQKSWYENISPEFNINYIINKPRTISVKTFRKSEYRGLIEGKVMRTGVGIMFQKDFNSTGELFRKSEEEIVPVVEKKYSK